MRMPMAYRRGSAQTTFEKDKASDDTTTSNSVASSMEDSNCSSIEEIMVMSSGEEHGLLITLDDACRMTFCRDANYKEINPNVYAPAVMKDVGSLPGGGSGAAVFGGKLPELGSIVMKHGGHRETKELFALATVSQELQKRGVQVPEEANNLRERIPEYRMMYVSPHHLQEKPFSLTAFMRAFLPMNCPRHSSQPGVHNKTWRRIRLCAREDVQAVSLKLHKESLDVDLHAEAAVLLDDASCQYGPAGEGYSSLKAIIDQLEELQKQNRWKFTLGQKTIGGAHPETAAYLLTKGQLHGELLENLIDQFIDVIHSLQALTTPEEADVVDTVRKELGVIQSNHNLTAADVSKLVDAFCGYSLKKNWHPKLGRFVRLRDMGEQFRSSKLALTPEEVLPARLLGILLRPGSKLGNVYEGAPLEDVSLELDVHKWRSVLAHAVLGIRCRAALRRVWTCGLSDAGLHNLFLSRDNMWLFDLGEPSLQALPGFLTKFLFSFFHTLGMEEDGKGGWVNRFVPGDKLALTEETKALLPMAYDAFETTLDRLSDELFFGEDGVRGLMVQYITLQLLSDCAFCLERWAIKGGGHANREAGIEKWLWRALWDVYIAFDINTKEWTMEPYRCYYSAFRRTQSNEGLRKQLVN